MNRKARVARLSVLSNIVLIILKLVVGFMTGAVSIISEAIHSTMDLAAALIAFVSVRIADQPPDKSHPFGHEKIENISSVIETILIFAASIFIVQQAVRKLMNHAPVEAAGLGFGVMVVSAVVNTFVSRKLYAVAREENSVAIEADALHLKADVYTSAGVAAGLLLLWVTGFHILDPIVAILIAVFILKEAAGMLLKSFGPLMDEKLPDDEIAEINKIMENHAGCFVDYHELRTRKSGSIKHIDLHVTTPAKMTVGEYHALCDIIEKEIEGRLSRSKVLIHAEPCANECAACAVADKNKICGTEYKGR